MNILKVMAIGTLSMDNGQTNVQVSETEATSCFVKKVMFLTKVKVDDTIFRKFTNWWKSFKEWYFANFEMCENCSIR